MPSEAFFSGERKGRCRGDVGGSREHGIPRRSGRLEKRQEAREGLGVTRQLDTAVRNAVRTAASQLAGQITMQNVEQTETEYVEVSAHWGAREGVGHANHAGWQGKVCRVQGSDSEYENLEEATGLIKAKTAEYKDFSDAVGIRAKGERSGSPHSIACIV